MVDETIAACRKLDRENARDRSSGAVKQFVVADAILFLDTLADRLDRWASQSQSGGWSTHQVSANTAAADECRRMAARLRSAYGGRQQAV